MAGAVLQQQSWGVIAQTVWRNKYRKVEAMPAGSRETLPSAPSLLSTKPDTAEGQGTVALEQKERQGNKPQKPLNSWRWRHQTLAQNAT